MIDWKVLDSEQQLHDIKERSMVTPQVIFKHSTRCSISSVAKARLDKSKAPQSVDFYYLDLIKYRSISNKIESEFSVHHESPQVILIKEGACIYEESHTGISMDEIEEQVNK